MEPDLSSMSQWTPAEAGDLGADFSLCPHSPAQQRRRLIVLGIVIAVLASPFAVLGRSTYTGTPDLHAMIEIMGAFFGLLAGSALIARFYALGNRLQLLVGLAFLVNGAEDFANGFLSLCGERGWAAWAGSPLGRFIPGTYATGRLLFGLILLVAPSLSRRLGRSVDPRRETIRASSLVLVLALAATGAAFLVPLPAFIFPERVISRPVDFVSALVLAGALFAFVWEYRRRGDAMAWWVALSIAINTVGQAMMSFSKALYDPFFDVSHVYKVLGYMSPLLGFSLCQIAILRGKAAAERELRRHRDSLEALVKQRTDELARRNQQLQSGAAERAGAEEALRSSEQKYRGIVDNVGSGIALISPEMEILELNRTMRLWFPHAKPDERPICYRTYNDPPRQEPCPYCPTIKTLRDGQVHEAVTETPAGDGVLNYRIISSPVCDASGRVVAAIEMVEDVTERQRAARALQESEARYRALVEDMPALICRFTPDGVLTFVNDAYCDYFGRKREELIGRHFSEFIPEDERQAVKDHYRSLTADRPVTGYEHAVVAPDGSVRYQRWTDRLVCDRNGLPAEYQSIGMDITERRNAEEALRESENRYRTLLGTLPQRIFLKDRDCVYVSCNENYARDLGIKPDEIVGKTDYDFYARELADKYRRDDRAVMESAKTEDIEEQYVQEGRELWVHTVKTPFKDPQGNVVGVLGIFWDITAHKRAQEELRQSQQKYYHLFHHLNDAAFLADVDTGELLDANKQAEALLGRTREEVIGVHQSKLHPPGKADEYRARFQRHVAQGSAADFDAEVCRKDGSIIPVRISASTVVIGGRACILGLFHDLTEQRGAQDERRRLDARIQQAQKLESMGVLAGGIAHDFNNLLTGVIGNAGLALMDLPADSPARRSIEEIELAARRAAELAGQMLAYSGRGRFVVELLDLSDLVGKMQRLLQSAVSKRVALVLDLADALPAAEADASQLRQVVMNLVTNASEAIGEGEGVVAVRTCLLDADTSFLAGSHVDDDLPSGPYVCLEVSDTGCGMDEETQAKVFEPFFSTKFTGRGLGLAAVLGIVRGHGGAIRIESEPGKGSTFRVLLPVSRATARKAAEDGGTRAEQWQGGGAVLVVDDEESVRRVSKAALERSGFVVLTAEDGRQALETFQRDPGRIRAVLLDLTMPHMGAEEAVKELHRVRRDLPIILSSGYGEDEVVRRFAGEDLAGFIQKPYDPETLVRTLREALAD